LVAIALAVTAAVIAWRHPWPGVVAIAVAGPLTWLLLRRALRMVIARSEAERLAEVANLRAVAVPVGRAWRTLLGNVGLDADLDRIAPHVRSALRLVLAPIDEPGGYTSQANGDPWLPPDFAWPEHDGKPMRFLLQIDLAEAHRAHAELPFEAEGTLYVFEAMDDFAYRAPVAPPGERIHTPARGADPKRKTLRVTLEHYEDLPEREVLGAIAEGWDAGKRAGYDSMQTFLEGNGGPLHKLLGHPNPVQDLESIEPRDRRLLLQIDSDEDAGWEWGDGGRTYLTVPAADLARGDVSRIEAEGQCG
jgi:uncharacterized protein YwqG